MAANQSIQEEVHNNGGVEVVKKVNINFAAIKPHDSKKRLRNPANNSVFANNSQAFGSNSYQDASFNNSSM